MDKKWIEEYSKAADRTANHSFKMYGRMMQIQLEEDDGEVTFLSNELSQDIIHGILGMVGEEGEVSEAAWNADNSLYENERLGLLKENIRKEIGDFMWYANRVAAGLKTDFVKVMESEEGERKEMATQRMAENLKKWLFYGKRMKRAEMVLLLERSIKRVCDLAGSASDENGTINVMKMILEENIQKLKKRFPERFTEADAIARVDV